MARVLVVEDEDTTRLLLEARLRWAGHRVRAVASAPEARGDRARLSPEVVVTDMFMPSGSGLGLVSDLRADPDSATVPVSSSAAARCPATSPPAGPSAQTTCTSPAPWSS